MTELVTFIRARPDEAEHIARETPEESRTWTHRSFVDYSAPDLPVDDHTLWFGDRIIGEVGFGDGEILPDEAEHIARHDPARVLREVEAKRRILDEVVDEATGLDMQVDSEFRVGSRDEVAEPYLGDVLLRLLALPYADHPDYRDEWRPA